MGNQESVVSVLLQWFKTRKCRGNVINASVQIISNIILASFAIFAFFQVGNQFELGSRPYIGLENGADETKIIVQDTTYDNKPDIGVSWLPEEVGLGIRIQLSFRNYGHLPANFDITASSTNGTISQIGLTNGVIMPDQTKKVFWNHRLSNSIPSSDESFVRFSIVYTPSNSKKIFHTLIEGKWVEIPTKDEDVRKEFPIRIGIENGKEYGVVFQVAEAN